MPTASDNARWNAGLQRSKEVRVYRSALKRRIAAGAVRVEDVIYDGDDRLDTMPVIVLLRAMDGIQTYKARGILGDARVGEMKTVGELTDQERDRLADRLWERRERRPHRRRVAA